MNMNIKPLDRMITAKDYSPDGTSLGYLKAERDRIAREKGIYLEINETPAGTPLLARIERGQWIVDCECGGATFVDPEWPYTFCLSCRANNGHIRPVKFPGDWREIEKTLLARPVNDVAGLTDKERAPLAKPLLAVKGKGILERSWLPHETLEDLHAQQDKVIHQWHKHLRGGK